MIGGPSRYAGLGARLFAAAIDTAVLAGPLWVVAWFLRGLYLDGGEILVVVVSAVAAGAYSAIMIASPLQGTLGKRLMKIVVSDHEGVPLTLTAAVTRTLLVPLSLLPLGAGLLLAVSSPRRQTLHDLICRTIVLHEPDPVRLRDHRSTTHRGAREPGEWRGYDR